jgi:hypothetical protein
MPVITFDKQHLDEGFLFLARRGEVGCLPNDVFAINDALFDLLKQSSIPFTLMEKQHNTSQGDVRVKSEKKRTQGLFITGREEERQRASSTDDRGEG